MKEHKQKQDKVSPTEPVVILQIPTSEGYWKKVFEGEETFWDVYFRQYRMEFNVAIATNENQTDPCETLSGEWVKISNEYQGPLKADNQK